MAKKIYQTSSFQKNQNTQSTLGEISTVFYETALQEIGDPKTAEKITHFLLLNLFKRQKNFGRAHIA